ncbi:MAG: hypothetical protein ACKO7A_11835 [Microcystis sp.]
MARMSLIVRNLVKQGFWQDASLANTLLEVIWGKVLAITPKWGDIRKVDLYCYFQECYTETFRIICSSTVGTAAGDPDQHNTEGKCPS